MISEIEGIKLGRGEQGQSQTWVGPENAVLKGSAAIREVLSDLGKPVYVVVEKGSAGVTNVGELIPGLSADGMAGRAFSPVLLLEQLGDPEFRKIYRTRYAYMAGAMANAIASAELVIALGNAGMLGSFGSAGLVPARLEEAILRVQEALPNGPFAFNLIHSPSEEAMERNAVALFLKYGVHTVEASAFLGLTPSVVHYRVAGLSQAPDGGVNIQNRVIVKLSRKEVAQKFMSPPPENILSQLVAEGKISALQAKLAQLVPVADDVTVEADSGGHTDNRPLIVLLPTMLTSVSYTHLR